MDFQLSCLFVREACIFLNSCGQDDFPEGGLFVYLPFWDRAAQQHLRMHFWGIYAGECLCIYDEAYQSFAYFLWSLDFLYLLSIVTRQEKVLTTNRIGSPFFAQELEAR